MAEVAWIGGGKALAVATSTGVSWRDPVTGEETRAFPANDAILNLAVSPSAKWMMTGNQDCSIHVWNTESGAEMHMRGFRAKVRQLAWHRGSRWLAAGGGPVVSVWDCSGRGPEGRTPALFEFHTDPVSALHYQPQGDWLASGARGRQRGRLVADPAPASRLRRQDPERGWTRVAWSPDGSRLAAAGEAGELQVLAVE